MKNILQYLIRYPVFSNLLMLALLLGGMYAAINLKRERLPAFALDQISVVVPYPDALPEEVEEAICIKIEEELEGLDGIKKIVSTAFENTAQVMVELENGADSLAVLGEIRNKVDSIDTFPDDAESPIITELFSRSEMINLSLYGDAPERVLKEISRQIKDDLTSITGITQVTISGTREYELSIEVSENALREYGLTFAQVVNVVRGSSLNLPGGTLRTENREIRLQTNARKYTGKEYDNIIVLTRPDGTSIRLGDIARTVDGFEENIRVGYFNRKPSVLLTVYRMVGEDALGITASVREYVDKKQNLLPDGLKLTTWSDRSLSIYDRMDLLIRNGRIGLFLVLVSLGFFLSLRLSFWVAMGIPISFGGGLLALWFFGYTLNMISMFAMIMALGIVVDDAIVVGENVYSHRQRGASGTEAALIGTLEVAGPVTAAVLTSITAFLPLLLISGRMGKIVGDIAVVMIAVLTASLIECLFIMPAHLNFKQAHKEGRISKVQGFFERTTQWFIHSVYKPVFLWSLKNRLSTLAVAIAIAMFTIGLSKGGQIPFIFFPKLDNEYLQAKVSFAQGTPATVTLEAVRKIEEEAFRLNRLSSEKPIVKNVYSVVGEDTGFGGRSAPHLGSVVIELIPGEQRNIHSEQITKEWRSAVGNVTGALSLAFGSTFGHSGGKSIEIAFLSNNYEYLQEATDSLKAELEKFSAVSEVEDDFRPGKMQITPKIKPEARLLGLDERMVGMQIFQGFAGQEVMRLQRGRDEVKVKVRYPKDERDDFSNLENIRIRLPDNTEVPFYEIADLSFRQGPAKIKRQDRRRIIAVSAEVDQKKTPAGEIVDKLQEEFLPNLLQKYPGLTYSLEGDEQQRRESTESLMFGFIAAIFVIFTILATIFGSYLQPLIIISVIPFGYIGALLGHWLLGYHITMMSIFGVVALSGIVVNDSLVLVAKINSELARGMTFEKSIIAGGIGRFRAIVLTSLTTFVGLLPILSEESLQAQFIIPMALSISSGLVCVTFLTLFLIPCLMTDLNFARRGVHWFFSGHWPSAEEIEPAHPSYRYRH